MFVTGQGNPLPTLTWLRDDVPINESADARITIMLLPNTGLSRITSIISISPTVPSDSGRYTCVVSNEAGSVTAFFDVTVNGRLKILNIDTAPKFTYSWWIILLTQNRNQLKKLR